MNKKYIVQNIEFDPKFKNAKEIEDLEFKVLNAYGVWDSEGRTEDERINNLYNKYIHKRSYINVSNSNQSYRHTKN